MKSRVQELEIVVLFPFVNLQVIKTIQVLNQPILCFMEDFTQNKGFQIKKQGSIWPDQVRCLKKPEGWLAFTFNAFVVGKAPGESSLRTSIGVYDTYDNLSNLLFKKINIYLWLILLHHTNNSCQNSVYLF